MRSYQIRIWYVRSISNQGREIDREKHIQQIFHMNVVKTELKKYL